MERILSSQVAAAAGSQVKLKGHVHKIRKMGKIMFVVLRDRSGLIQVVVEDEGQRLKLAGLTQGTAIEVAGAAVMQPGGKEPEVSDAIIEVISPVTDQSPIEIDKDFSIDDRSMESLLKYRAVSLRGLRQRSVFEFQSELMQQLRVFLRGHDFTEMRTPKLLAEPTEGGAEVFKMDYFGQTATLAQSAQFYKQMMVGVFERVYEFGATYRAEPSATTRHMTEFTTLDVEMGFIDFDELKEIVHQMLSAVSAKMADSPEAHAYGAQMPKIPKDYVEIPLQKVHELYSAEDGNPDTRGEDDLTPDEERWICKYALDEYGSDVVSVTQWPIESMKFYHRADKSGEFAERMDVLMRGVEIITCSMREYRYDVLIEQMRGRGIDPNEPGFEGYLQAFKYGMPPHGGFGMGLERLTAQMLGLPNVKLASLFPRDIRRLAP